MNASLSIDLEREFDVVSASIPKAGAADAECQDAFFSRAHASSTHLSISDGATRGVGQRLWARLLTKHATQDRPSATADLDTRRTWLEGPRAEWKRRRDAEPPPPGAGPDWMREITQHWGAAATLVYVQLRWEQGATSWEACALGDSCMFIYREQERTPHYAFPISRVGAFNSTPDLIYSQTSPADDVGWESAEGEFGDTDLLVLATDAVAKYLLSRADGDKLWELRTDAQIRAYLRELQDRELIEDDDLTLAIVRSRSMPNRSRRVLSEADSVSTPTPHPAPAEVRPPGSPRAKPARARSTPAKKQSRPTTSPSRRSGRHLDCAGAAPAGRRWGEPRWIQVVGVSIAAAMLVQAGFEWLRHLWLADDDREVVVSSVELSSSEQEPWLNAGPERSSLDPSGGAADDDDDLAPASELVDLGPRNEFEDQFEARWICCATSLGCKIAKGKRGVPLHVEIAEDRHLQARRVEGESNDTPPGDYGIIVDSDVERPRFDADCPDDEYWTQIYWPINLEE